MTDRQRKILLNTASVLLFLALIVAGLLREHYFKKQSAPKTPEATSPPRPGSATKTTQPSLHPAAADFASRLSQPALTAEEDLQNLEQLIELYRRSHGENPEGDNADVVTALMGQNRHQTAFLPNHVSFIQDGHLVDRWGTPYFLHPETSHRMSIRSAGPDHHLFTDDDVTLE